MSCPNCGDERTEVLKTFYRGRNTYRLRRCCFCKNRSAPRNVRFPGTTCIGNGRDERLPEKDGEEIAPQHFAAIAKWNPAAGISEFPE